MKPLLQMVTAALVAASAHAAPLLPHGDDQVIETLPAAVGDRAEERRLRRDWAADPRDPAKALPLARRYFQQARDDGDPRRAGQALAALQAWPDAATAPDEVLLMRATIEQHLHDFDASAAHLGALVKRRPRHAQAWLTLATVRRVQGRYADSDAACTGLAAAGADLPARACRAENDGLRGDVARARAQLCSLLATPRLPAEIRAWLLTTRAELAARAGQPAEAEAAYRAALAVRPDAYTTLSYADFLLQRERGADARRQLQGQPRNDAVLLRLAIAGGGDDAQAMRERMALAGLRPEAGRTHAREQAMFALWVDRDPRRALLFARANLQHQREPLDLLLLAAAARAAGDPAAGHEAARIAKEIGLHDQRLDALLS
jgi:Tfp pilus assembly protein PilF